MNDKEYVNIFSPSQTHIDLVGLAQDLKTMERNLRKLLSDLERKEDYSSAGKVQKLIDETEELQTRLNNLQADDVTDEKYQIDEAKRGIARKIYAFFNSSVLQKALEEYFEMKNYFLQGAIFDPNITEQDKEQFNALIKNEKETLQSDNLSIVKMKTKQIESLLTRISSRQTLTNNDIVAHFGHVRSQPYLDQTRANGLIVKGEQALSQSQFPVLLDVVNQLYQQLRDEKNNSGNNFNSAATGLR